MKQWPVRMTDGVKRPVKVRRAPMNLDRLVRITAAADAIKELGLFESAQRAQLRIDYAWRTGKIPFSKDERGKRVAKLEDVVRFFMDLR